MCDPLQANNIAQREFNKLIEKAGVRRSSVHGVRHSSATLVLQNGVSVKRFSSASDTRGSRSR
jgi:integrase